MFLLCKDVLYGLNLDSYIEREALGATLTIPTDSGKNEIFSFEEFPDSLEKKNVLLKDVSVTLLQSKTCINHSDKSEPGIVYALLRDATCIPDDVFISKKHSNNIELIKKISYTTCEPDYGDYTVGVYFVKIALAADDLVHIYFENSDSYFLKNHIALYCDDDMKVTFYDNLKTVTMNDDEFISLSDLESNG